jgi:hypothetical protein
MDPDQGTRPPSFGYPPTLATIPRHPHVGIHGPTLGSSISSFASCSTPPLLSPRSSSRRLRSPRFGRGSSRSLDRTPSRRQTRRSCSKSRSSAYAIPIDGRGIPHARRSSCTCATSCATFGTRIRAAPVRCTRWTPARHATMSCSTMPRLPRKGHPRRHSRPLVGCSGVRPNDISTSPSDIGFRLGGLYGEERLSIHSHLGGRERKPQRPQRAQRVGEVDFPRSLSLCVA